MDKKLRKNRDILSASALAVMAFAVWSVIKTVLQIFMNWQTYKDLADASDMSPFLYILITAIFMLIDLVLRFLTYRGAKKESRGEKSGLLHIVLAVLMVIVSLMNVSGLFISGFGSDIFDFIATAVVELTSLYALIELIVTSIRIKQLEKMPAAA